MRKSHTKISTDSAASSVDLLRTEQIVPMIVKGDEEHLSEGTKPFAHIPDQQRNDTTSTPALIRRCWFPLIIFLLVILTPFILVWKIAFAIFVVFKYAYLAIADWDKFVEHFLAWGQRHYIKKTRRKPLSMEKQTAGIDLNLKKVEKRTYHRMQPTPEYLALENLIIKFVSKGESQEHIFVRANQLKEKKSIGLRKQEVQRCKKILCGMPFKPETNCCVSRSNYRIESYWMIWPGVQNNAPVILYLHGGGFLVGNTLLFTYADYLSKLSHLSKCRVLSINYRLIPQWTICDAMNDCEGAFDWLLEDQCLKPSQIALSGDSAGGCLSLLLMQRLMKKGKPLPACAHLISPLVRMYSYKEWNNYCGRYSGVCLLTQSRLIAISWELCSGVIGLDMLYKPGAKVDFENSEMNPL